jgi:hypothetical protein
VYGDGANGTTLSIDQPTYQWEKESWIGKACMTDDGNGKYPTHCGCENCVKAEVGRVYFDGFDCDPDSNPNGCSEEEDVNVTCGQEITITCNDPKDGYSGFHDELYFEVYEKGTDNSNGTKYQCELDSESGIGRVHKLKISCD